ncbi:alkyl sulfatase BDS1-like metallo-beta-lactamase superfamily hydrolase [Litorivivens lipolytica]|uniref:Alkyl sulfatase BDS1-like metallo-beta-lactamase superfamily hydrolase n=1 Tax=Litorivivens lipolytica TaxID=1524264 RepID=A0A7W4W687_9GAMM|nr:alkyl sulfatase dimerization domain-containing protein [Litorivivens lipolytica]MBB3048263.1 alkyl sulfatase BDS1-like metallo-beta-lactamase superfamily hydrolase [Litorivivens lipolytica]
MRQAIYKERPIEPNPSRFDSGKRINDFISLSEAFSNVYRIETSEGIVQLNAGMGMEAPVIDANLASFSEQPLHTLILTQGHVDHVGGVAYFREKNPGLRVIAGANNPEHQAYDGRLGPFRGNRSAFAFTSKFMKAFAHYQEHGYTEYPAQDTPVPDLLVDERYSFELGGIAFEIIAVPGAETNDSVIVWLPKQRICFTGNLFGCPFGHFPNLVTIRGDRYREALVVARAVEVVRELEPKMILYGHHGPIVGSAIIQDELKALHGAILHVHDETVKGMNSGKTVHQLMQEIRIPPELHVGEGYGKVSWSVRAIWESYAGWFHHESTTELYSVPANSVHTDIVELAGVDNLLTRAQEKYRGGHYEQALHLLDLIHNARSGTSASYALARDIHQALLKQSENFWLSSWLRHQIDLLSEKAEAANKEN